MKNTNIKNSEPTKENIKKASEGYNAADRDFQRTQKDIDDVSRSEENALEEKKQRLKDASTTPDKNRVS